MSRALSVTPQVGGKFVLFEAGGMATPAMDNISRRDEISGKGSVIDRFYQVLDQKVWMHIQRLEYFPWHVDSEPQKKRVS